MSAQLLWAAVVGFLAGVYLRSFLTLGWYAVGFVLLMATAVLLTSLVFRRRRTLLRRAKSNVRHAIILCVALLACAGGIARMQGAALESEPTFDVKLGTKTIIEGVLFEEPDVRENSTRLSIRTDVGAGVLVAAPPHVDVAYGDRIRAEGVLRIPESFETGVGRAFDYPAYLAKEGIGYELAFAEVEVIGKSPISMLPAGGGSAFGGKAAAIWVKQKYLEGLARALPEPHAGLAGGITAGDKRGLGSELSRTFRTVGLIHIVVLSGYNIMVVIGFVEWLFRRAHRYVRFSLGIGVAILFALMTGLASSSVRAASMAAIATVGKATGRIYLASRALAVVAFLMVLWNPWILAFDPGFQLSVIATWGLISVSSLVVPHLWFITEKFNLREIAATTIGTQLAVLPLLLYQNGQFSLVALPANLLALIVVPYAMLASFIAGIAGLVTGPLAPVIGFPAYVLLSYILFVAESAARIPFASISVGAFPITLVLLCYLVFVCIGRPKTL